MKKIVSLLVTGLLATTAVVSAQDEAPAPPAPGSVPSAEGAKVYIISPADGDTVKGPVTIQFGLKGMGVCPAGLYLENTGHHHLLVNMGHDDMPKGIPMPTIDEEDKKMLHFGKGQTETTLELKPGKYTLLLAFADYGHMMHVPPVMSEMITITVE